MTLCGFRLREIFGKFRRFHLALLVSCVFVLTLILCCARSVHQSTLDSSLIAAISRNDASQVRDLLARGANANVRVYFPSLQDIMIDSWSCRKLVLHEGRRGSRSALQFASFPISQKFMLSFPNKSGQLEYAVYNPKVSGINACVSALLDYGADANPSGDIWDCPLIWACASNDLHLVEQLLRHHADPNGCSPDNGLTPIGYGDHGDKWPAIPLYFAVRNGNIPMVRCLLEAGADPNRGSREGAALLDVTRYSKPSMIKLLLDHGACQTPSRSGTSVLLIPYVDSFQYRLGDHKSVEW